MTLTSADRLNINYESVRVADVTKNRANLIVSAGEISGGWTITLYDHTDEIYTSPRTYPSTKVQATLTGLLSGMMYTAVVRDSETEEEVRKSESFRISELF